MTIRRIGPTLGLSLALLSVACNSGNDPGPSAAPATGVDASTYAAQVATTDMTVDRPERVQIGIFSSTQDAGVQVLSFGDVDVSFAYLGPDGSQTPQAGPTATASYLAAPTTPDEGHGPALTDPSEARGVYQAEDVEFAEPGVWTATVRTDVLGVGPLTLGSTFTVKPRPTLPAPGQKALKTENLTIGSKGVKPISIDSRAVDDGPVPDPNLHEWTIADAVAQGRPALVLFATPRFCQSIMCGPAVDGLADLAEEYPDEAVYIHVEIWKRFDPDGSGVVNQAAADWLYRDGDLTEPWLYLIGADGVILDRWGPLFDQGEVGRALSELPA